MAMADGGELVYASVLYLVRAKQLTDYTTRGEKGFPLLRLYLIKTPELASLALGNSASYHQICAVQPDAPKYQTVHPLPASNR
jgi:hypothetical protein